MDIGEEKNKNSSLFTLGKQQGILERKKRGR